MLFNVNEKMPGGTTHFQNDWLDLMDDNRNRIGDWCRPSKLSKTAGYCHLCCKEIPCCNAGIGQIKQHALGKGHQQKAKDRLGQGQTKLMPSSSGGAVCDTHQNRVTTAEVLWAMNCVEHDYSFNSADKSAELFRTIFPDSDIAKNFSMGATKLTYVVNDGLGPLFHNEVVDDLKNGKNGYIVVFDENPTDQNKNQMDIHVRFFSSISNQVADRFFKSIMFGHKPAEKVANAILDCLKEDNIPLNKCIGLTRDGPNVNKATETKMNAILHDSGCPGLLNLGSCVLHTVHNTFKAGLEKYGGDAQDLVIELFYFFKNAARREDFAEVQMALNLEEHSFFKHCDSRWITLIPVLQRANEQLPAVQKFFDELAKKEKRIETQKRYCRIKKLLALPDIKVQIEFDLSVGTVFQAFLKKFQAEEPLIHQLYDDMVSMMKLFCSKFMKSDVVDVKTAKDLVEIKFDDTSLQLQDGKLEIGENTKKAVLEIESSKRRLDYLNIRAFFRECAQYMAKKLPLSNEVLRDLRFLGLKRKDAAVNVERIRRMARKLPHVICRNEIDDLMDEVHVSKYTELPAQEDGERIDNYWIRTVDSKVYPKLIRLAKTALAVGHGSADVERGFSTNKQSVTVSRNRLSETAVNGIRSVKDGLKNMQKRAHEVTVTREMISATRNARKAYDARLKKQEEEKILAQSRKREENERKEQLKKKVKSLQDRETEIDKEEKKLSGDIEIAEEMMKDANRKMQSALNEKKR